MKNDEEKTSETDDSIKITSMKIDIIHLKSFHSREQSKTYDCLSSAAIIESFIESLINFFHRLISLSVALFCDSVEQTISENDREAATIIHFSYIITVSLSLLEQHQNQEDLALHEKEWEIVRIVDKRRREKNYEYKMCWKKTWLRECKLENTQKLLRDFKAKSWAQCEDKRERLTYADNDRWLLITLLTVKAQKSLDSMWDDKFLNFYFMFHDLLSSYCCELNKLIKWWKDEILTFQWSDVWNMLWCLQNSWIRDEYTFWHEKRSETTAGKKQDYECIKVCSIEKCVKR